MVVHAATGSATQENCLLITPPSAEPSVAKVPKAAISVENASEALSYLSRQTVDGLLLTHDLGGKSRDPRPTRLDCSRANQSQNHVE